jgi:hypothetical protein
MYALCIRWHACIHMRVCEASHARMRRYVHVRMYMHMYAVERVRLHACAFVVRIPMQAYAFS